MRLFPATPTVFKPASACDEIALTGLRHRILRNSRSLCFALVFAGSAGAVQGRPARDVRFRYRRLPERLRGDTVGRRPVLDLPLQHLRAQLAAAQLHPLDHRVRT